VDANETSYVIAVFYPGATRLLPASASGRAGFSTGEEEGPKGRRLIAGDPQLLTISRSAGGETCFKYSDVLASHKSSAAGGAAHDEFALEAHRE